MRIHDSEISVREDDGHGEVCIGCLTSLPLQSSLSWDFTAEPLKVSAYLTRLVHMTLFYRPYHMVWLHVCVLNFTCACVGACKCVLCVHTLIQLAALFACVIKIIEGVICIMHTGTSCIWMSGKGSFLYMYRPQVWVSHPLPSVTYLPLGDMTAW